MKVPARSALSVLALLNVATADAEIVQPAVVTVQLFVCPLGKERLISECGAQAEIQSDVTKLLSFHDYPAGANRLQRGGVVYFRLFADTSKPFRGNLANGYSSGDCKIIQSSGHDDLDNETCTILKRRVAFAPDSVDAVRSGVDGRVIWTPSWQIQSDFPAYPQPHFGEQAANN